MLLDVASHFVYTSVLLLRLPPLRSLTGRTWCSAVGMRDDIANRQKLLMRVENVLSSYRRESFILVVSLSVVNITRTKEEAHRHGHYKKN